jgi:hypothetical protein
MRVKQNKKSKVGHIRRRKNENLPLSHILSVSLDAEDEVNNVEHIVEVLIRKILKLWMNQSLKIISNEKTTFGSVIKISAAPSILILKERTNYCQPAISSDLQFSAVTISYSSHNAKKIIKDGKQDRVNRKILAY